MDRVTLVVSELALDKQVEHVEQVEASGEYFEFVSIFMLFEAE